MLIGTQDFEYVLDNEFFKNIEGEEIDSEADGGFFRTGF